MSAETSVQDEAERLFASRVADMRTFLARGEAAYEDSDDDELELGSVYDYGLDWSRWLTDQRAGTTTYVHLLSTGGPHICACRSVSGPLGFGFRNQDAAFPCAPKFGGRGRKGPRPPSDVYSGLLLTEDAR